MKKPFYLFIVLLITGLFLNSVLAQDRETRTIRYYFSSNYNYPGEPINVQINLDYHSLKIKENFQEEIKVKIYKLPADLSSDKYEKYSSENFPVRELKKIVNMEASPYPPNWWIGSITIALPALTSGNYYIICSSPEAKCAGSFRVNKIGLSVKTSKDFFLVFVQDYKTGSHVENAEVKFYLPEDIKTFNTDKDGLVKVYYKDLQGIKKAKLKVIATSGEDSAEVTLDPSFFYSEVNISKGYIYTDRPVYRPSQTVNFKGIFRIQKGYYLNYASRDVNISIHDPQNSEIYKNTLKTDEYGTVSGNFTLSKEASLGYYFIECTDPNGLDETGVFSVQEYRKPEFKIDITPDKPHYAPGEKMTFNMNAKYYFGSPVPDTEYSYEIFESLYSPWEEDTSTFNEDREEIKTSGIIKSGSGKTDKDGKSDFSLDIPKITHEPDQPVYDVNYTAHRAYAVKCTVIVRMTDESRREVIGSSTALIAKGDFCIRITPEKYFYRPGDKVNLKIEAKDYDGKPVPADLLLNTKYEIYNEKNKSSRWKEVNRKNLATDKNGIAYYDIVPDKDGYYEFECNGSDRNKNKIKSTAYICCYSRGNCNWNRLNNVEIIPDKDFYDVGETATFFLLCPYKGVKALVTAEGEEILNQEIIDFSDKTADFKVKMTKKHTPDFYITVNFFYDGRFYYQTKKIVCPPRDKFLKVSIEADKEKYRPREKVKFILKTTDQYNHPVSSHSDSNTGSIVSILPLYIIESNTDSIKSSL